MKRLIVVEKSEDGYGAWAPDLPGCVAVGGTREETERLMREAVEMHIEAMVKDGLPVPDPQSYATYVETVS